MDKFDPNSLPDVPDIPASIVASGLSDAPLTTLVEIAMQRLVQSGVPIDRMNVGFRILHPLFDGMSITWTREKGAEVFYASLVDKEGSEFRVSPFFVMLSQGMREWRLRLDRDPAVSNFPILADLRAKGYTDYLALIVAFGGAELHPQSLDGLATSWSTRSPQGFSDADVAAMCGVLTPLALVFRLAIKDQITKAALNTFHGPLVGGRSLAGSIKRGDGERLSAALWYSDLRNSTGLADQLPVDAFLDLLNAYFDCAAGAVMEQGGQVLDIIGDAILAFFPAGDNGGAEACALALEAAASARDRLATLKREGSGKSRAIEFGIGVHYGDVVFGNAGTPERLKFGVLGRAVNEVARTADMAKSLKRPVVVSDEVARRASVTLADLGLHELRGIPVARRLWAMEVG
ncbi:adenylate/guanylate cyclase domain-containing protein [Methyloceanibacter sp.]|uniref:adenylate/guanylate cyclase domain-containing protein n=1 Tax=Methyloceanibacter sp. TaxID=1965321 RepID=UPI00351B0736